MFRVGKFEKVSFSRFFEDMKSKLYSDITADQEKELKETIRHVYDNIQIPERATSGSAGYDIRSPINFTLRPGESITVPTGIRVEIEDGWWVSCLPRSSLGFKRRMQLDNTAAVIDSDYYYSENEGHIFIKVTNDNKEGKLLEIKEGDGFVQAIFIPYGVTYSDNAQTKRNGGVGSTGK